MVCQRLTLRWVVLLFVVVWAPQLGFAKKKPPLHPINLNTASSAKLLQVPGIGPSTADKILQMRKLYGAFKSVDDRRDWAKKLDNMRKYLSVGKPTQSKQGAASAQAKAPPAKNVATKPEAVGKKPVQPKTDRGAGRAVAVSNQFSVQREKREERDCGSRSSESTLTKQGWAPSSTWLSDITSA